eukprot:TRINITY_DN6009_c0_g1_i24.p1 TRINITY_DN6009_c0_g1~~TRINITY_DN6009_c0_g1_i24.p1  ORF type:complete len:162 (+),score=27.58 TRINITY_DN6009_c0_g1_i24:377-862(+)
MSKKNIEKQGSRTFCLVSFEIKGKEPKREEPHRWVTEINALISSYRKIPEGKRLLILINPSGGKGKALHIWGSVKKLFEISNIPHETVTTTRAGHAYDITHSLNLNDFYGLVTVSGDGLLNEALNGLMSRDDYAEMLRSLRFGVIPGLDSIPILSNHSCLR